MKSDPHPVVYFSSYSMLLLSWTRWRHTASGYKRRDDRSFFSLLADQSYSRAFHRARCNGLSGACLPPATQQLLSRTITVAAYKPRDEPCVAAPPSPNAPLLDGEAYMCSFSHEEFPSICAHVCRYVGASVEKAIFISATMAPISRMY